MIAAMSKDVHAIPQEVWCRFEASGGPDRVEPMRFLQPLTTVRLEQATAQQEADAQRHRFKRLIDELFLLDPVEAFIATNLEARAYPNIGSFDFSTGLMRPLEHALTREAKPVPVPFDLDVERMESTGKPRFDASEYRYAVELLKLRPALALAILFLRGYLVIWARALGDASRDSLTASQAPSFRFFMNAWGQSTLITGLYPAIALHLKPLIGLDAKRIDEPAFTRELMSDVMAWLTAKHFFTHHTTVESCGYDARLACAATGFMNQSLGRRGWLNMIFDKVVEDQRLPQMSKCLERVVARGNRLAAFAGRERASESAEWTFSLR